MNMLKNILKSEDKNTNNYNITGYKLQKSKRGGGFTKWHSELDVLRPSDVFKTSRRFGVWMVYLNNTDSGYTDFMHQKLSVKPETGKLVNILYTYASCKSRFKRR